MTRDSATADTPPTENVAPISAARERLLATAAETFYRDGITASGVDTIAARSGVSKPTLYAHFGSKSDLVTAVLEQQHERRREEVERYLGRRGLKPEEVLLAPFDWLAEWHGTRGVRGCAFLNAAVELTGAGSAAAREVVRKHKRWWCQLLTRLAVGAGARQPESLAIELLLLLDGANARMLVEGDAAAAIKARRAAAVLVREHLRNGRGKR